MIGIEKIKLIGRYESSEFLLIGCVEYEISRDDGMTHVLQHLLVICRIKVLKYVVTFFLHDIDIRCCLRLCYCHWLWPGTQYSIQITTSYRSHAIHQEFIPAGIYYCRVIFIMWPRARLVNKKFYIQSKNSEVR